ncbi:hypothetical protein RDI58_020091 [Solanum bulbocastanum]|uniref:Uncharacterized protein n=1 Tax=Solanum bulbocastanum TaxID=147425 RepID=A0AAN8T822_SOLBU
MTHHSRCRLHPTSHGRSQSPPQAVEPHMPGDEFSSTPQPLRSRRAMSLLAVAQPSIEATSVDCGSTRPWINALTHSRRRCATGLTLFLPAWGVAMDAKMKTP